MNAPRHDKFVEIAGRRIGPGYPPYVIAELSANHNGSLEAALRLIEAAPWLHAGETRLAWAGVAQVNGAPTGGSRFLDIALVCALGDVQEASGETVATRIRIHDRRARDLR